MLEGIDLRDWKKKKQIIKELEAKGEITDERVIRLHIEKHNILYCQGVNEDYIIHSNKGYKKTKDREEILASLNDYRKRALNMLWKCSQTKKAMNEKDNLRFELEEMELI